MTDIVLILATFAFVAICVAYIGWCDRIIGPDEPHADADSAAPRVGVAAGVNGTRDEVTA